jgi:beta-N-acetylhexosaminidase
VIAGVACVVAAGLVYALDGADPEEDGARRAARPAAATAPAPAAPRVPLRRMLGTMVMARMTGTTPSRAFLARVRAGRVGGVILFADNIGAPHVLRSAIARLQRAARVGGSPGLLIAVDQEGGIVKRLPGPPSRSAPSIGASGSTTLAERQGRATGRYLSGFGINVDLAPVLDVARHGSFMTSRSFGEDRRRVARLATAFARGLGRSGVAATAKHFPGLGLATANTDTAVSSVAAPLAALQRDELPFRRAIAAGIPMVMVSNAVYPAFGTRLPAALSKTIVSGELRGRLGFGGVVISDDLEAASVRNVRPPGAAAVTAAKAGVDMQLIAGSSAASAGVYRALLSAARSGELPRATIRSSHDRIHALARQLAPGR